MWIISRVNDAWIGVLHFDDPRGYSDEESEVYPLFAYVDAPFGALVNLGFTKGDLIELEFDKEGKVIRLRRPGESKALWAKEEI